MSSWNYVPQYEEDSDGDLWLTNFLSNLNSSTPDKEPKECESKKTDTEIGKIAAVAAKDMIGSAVKPKKIECSSGAKPTKTKKVKPPEIKKNIEPW